MIPEVFESKCRICDERYKWAGQNESCICSECLQQIVTKSPRTEPDWVDVLKEANKSEEGLMREVFGAQDSFSGLLIVLKAAVGLRRQMQELEAAVLAATIKAGKTPFAKAVSDELKRQKEQNAKRT